LIQRAAIAGCQLVWLPEASDYIGDKEQSASLLAQAPAFVDGVIDMAKQAGIWVDGAIVQAYDKLHLFDVDIKGGATILESKTTIPGSQLLPPVPTPIGKV
ncbi:Carbon-nitrogen hydrolase, partial [Microbotryomycetes sp. JL221]